MASIIIRTAIIYVLLSISLRIMGKRQIGELDIGELISTLLISEIASIPIADPDIPLLTAVISVLLLVAIEIILSTVKNRSEKMKEIVEGVPTYIIYKGRLLQDSLKNNRISVNELISEMRAQGVADIDEVEYCLIEQNGTLSVIKKTDTPLAHPIVIDGEIILSALTKQGLNEKWLYGKLREHRTSADKVFLMTVTDSGTVKIIPKEKEK